jgi:alpha-galactosidase/6-phospho-beta-glucosidase family protein
MKTVFIGGGSHRYLNVARSVLAEKGMFTNGEINVYDLNQERAEAMGRMIMKCPEYSPDCKISWGTTLEEALTGADVVIVVLMAGDLKNFALSNIACGKHGFIGSDQLSPSGAFLALKGGPIIMNIAREMEKYCPNAWLLDFANPVAVLSAAVNNHTSIKCLGVCAGYTNHLWDLPRMLMGVDEEGSSEDYKIKCAGVNHMGFILPGSTYKGEDLYEITARKVTDDWKMCGLSPRWNEFSIKNITCSVNKLVHLYRKYGVLVFSSEGDGLNHLEIEDDYRVTAAKMAEQKIEDIDSSLKKSRESRLEADRLFRSFIDQDMTPEEWDIERPESLYLLRGDENIMVKCNKGHCWSSRAGNRYQLPE